jgi:hypothetical protein
MAINRQKISQMTPKGANLEATDLLEISEDTGSGYVTKSITGQEIINSASGGSQDLQQVTDIGNTTNNPIIVQGAVNPALEVTLKTDGTIDLRNGSKTSTLANTNATNDGVKLEFPNKFHDKLNEFELI